MHRDRRHHQPGELFPSGRMRRSERLEILYLYNSLRPAFPTFLLMGLDPFQCLHRYIHRLVGRLHRFAGSNRPSLWLIHAGNISEKTAGRLSTRDRRRIRNPPHRPREKSDVYTYQLLYQLRLYQLPLSLLELKKKKSWYEYLLVAESRVISVTALYQRLIQQKSIHYKHLPAHHVEVPISPIFFFTKKFWGIGFLDPFPQKKGDQNSVTSWIDYEILGFIQKMVIIKKW